MLPQYRAMLDAAGRTMADMPVSVYGVAEEVDVLKRYRDAEVARVLNNDFIAVKIIQEQDLVGDYDLVMKEKLAARGIPAMGIFDAAGKPVHTIGGWKKPEDFLKELEAGKAAYAGQ